MKQNARIAEIDKTCNRCGRCAIECRFLQLYGLPGDIAMDVLAGGQNNGVDLSFKCSLCGLCGAVCPLHLNPKDMFLDMRKHAYETDRISLKTYRAILQYEKRGTSRLFTWYSFPDGCHTIFFPGCTLPGTRPHQTEKLFACLKKKIPDLGIVLDCCTKPSHDLGRQRYFEDMFFEMKAFLTGNNIRGVITACPNCYKVFSLYGREFDVKMAYPFINSNDVSLHRADGIGPLVIHDPCVLRGESGMHDAVRQLVASQGYPIDPMSHSGHKTFCCGEGGSVAFTDKALALNWAMLRKEEASGKRVITYCAGCAGFLNRIIPANHLLDLLFDPKGVRTGRSRVAKAPFTYVNRMKLKKRLRKNEPGAVTRERCFKAAE
ncbi:MAG: (Fe-S)-binding protein [Proteobacteria bacterium]|nr:(Fe-S)-binding protein [Pseudomonadota bacterium]